MIQKEKASPKADIFPKDEKIAFQDESGFVFMLNWTNIWISSLWFPWAVSLHSKEMTSDIKFPLAASDVPEDSRVLEQWSCPFLQISWEGSFTQ